MTTSHIPPDHSTARIREAVFTMVAEGHLNAAEARRLLVKAEPAPAADELPIAVIGMAGRFGDGNDLDDYWAMIDSGRDCLRPIPPHRWADGGHGAVGGFLPEPGLFDPLFFKIAPSEAALMDPQQRLFLETAWFALEDAALSERDLAGSACGVFVGVGAGDYGRRLEAAGVGDAPLALMGNVASILAARIAYLLDLKGPALAVDTACSSSLVAVHLACAALRRGECDTAIAGGVCVINSGRFLAAMSGAGMISPSGRCHAFDSRADGFVCGEGAGAVVLKRLDRALADGDVIHGVLLGDGMNQDGRTNGITAPSAPAQTALERAVQQRFGIEPAAIGYIETHGTGTPLGDPIEVEGLARAFGDRPKHLPKIPLGSVKGNIGHTLTAAGIAGLLKVLLMLRHGRIPPSPDFRAPNPRLGLDDTPFRIATHGETWTPGPEGRRIATVSSFGFSGTNAHLVVGESPTLPERTLPNEPLPILVSARDADALAKRAALLAACWRERPTLRLDDLAWTLAHGKTPQPRRAAFIASHRVEAIATLEALATGAELTRQGLPDRVTAWLDGENPDWRAIFPTPPRKVSLPLTPLNPILCEPPRQAIAARDSGDLEQVMQATAAFRAHAEPELFSAGESFAEVEEWARQAACAALCQAGLLSGGRKVLTRAALAQEFGVTPERRGLFDAMLPILARQGWLSIEGDVMRLAGTPTAQPDANALQSQQARLRREHPATAPFLDLLERTTAALPGVLRGTTDGNAVLFPEGRLDLVGAIYQGNHLADHFNRMMATAVATLVRRRLETNDGPVRILEIGAGTGGATTAILAALRPLGQRVHYLYTDVSLGFLKHGRDAFGGAVEPALFDATRPGEAQGFATGGCDIMVAANVLHAVPDLRDTMNHLWRLLAPGGVLALNEVTAVQDFATLTFGLTTGWWAFRDSERRLPGAPLADPERWRIVLAESGFPELATLGLTETGPHAQAILLARRDLRPAPPAPVGQCVTLPQPQTTPAPSRAAVNAAPAATLEAVIREEAAQTLGMAAQAIDPLGRFMDYGVDSILGLDLINRLNRRYGLDLSPTIVFEQPTVRDLARHLAETHGIRPDPPTGVAEAAPPTGQSSHPAHPTSEPATQPAMGGDPIAVIGMAGRFAAAEDLEAFHALLAEGRSGITEARERLGIDPDAPPEYLRAAAPYLRWGGLLRHIDRFDPMFFRISGREAELTDPQHRVFLTDVWRALEDAGHAGIAMESADCGIFVGCHGGDYTHLMAEHGVVPDAFAFTGNAASILAARIAYLLDLKGPALAVDTACSSSLVAVHLACQALRAGECDMAIAGGVFINTTVGFNTAAASAGMLSPRGRCAAFDADADGFVPGEGSGAVILKPLSKALADGDSVIAVIAGSATNQDGKTNGITAPNAASQASLIQRALRRAGVPPAAVQYVETHGTGTRLGDPIEIEGLTRGFAGADLAPGACLLGSVKSNVGHAAHAAGIAGLIKTLLSFRHGELYPSLHFHTPNPVLHLERTPFAINTRLRPWPRPPGGQRVAGVSSFGFSGTNCHIVLSDPPAAEPQSAATAPGALIALSARSPRALEQFRRNLAQWLDGHDGARLTDIAFTLGVGRSHFEHRWAVLAQDAASLRTALEQTETPRVEGLPDDRAAALDSAAALYRDGGLPDFAALHPGGRRIPLPTYPFDERSYWLTAPDTVASPVAVTQSKAKTPLPTMLTPVWEIRPATLPESLPGRVALAGDPARTTPVAEALRALGIDAVVLTKASAIPPETTAVMALFAPPRSDAVATLAPLIDVLRGMLAHPERRLTLLHVHDGSPLAAAAVAAGPSLRFLPGHVDLRSLALPVGFSAAATAHALLSECLTPNREAALDASGIRRIRHLRAFTPQPATLPAAGGVWLITGGLGGLGPLLAHHLGIQRGARIGLLGRSAPSGDKAAQLAELRAAGVQVHFVRADVADAAALARAVTEIETVLGPVSGVIHAAGVPAERSLADSGWDDMARTFASKVDGAHALDQVLAEKPLHAFLLFSSIAAELGDFGQCDYAIANAFLGRFAEWRNREVAAGRRQGRTVALAWPIWEGGHAALDAAGADLISKALGITPLARESGLAILDMVLSATDTPAEIVIMNGNRNDIERLTGETAATPARPDSGAPQAAPPAPPRERAHPADAESDGRLAATRAELTGMIARLLKLDPAELKPTAGFGDFGFDSIALKEFAELISRRHHAAISPAVFFTHGTIDALARYLVETYPTAHALPPANEERQEAATQSGGQTSARQERPLGPRSGFIPMPTGNGSTAAASPPIPQPALVGLKPDPRNPIATSPAPADRGAVAIIGMAGQFPGAADLEGFWRLIETGDIAVSAMPDHRRELLGLTGESRPMGGFIDAIEQFDPAFFHLSRREAVHMDPQQRLALTAAWSALEDAGIVPAALAERPVGVFLGQQVSGYAALLRDAAPEAMAQAALGNAGALMPNRISYLLDLRGPSELVDTACSSALVAVHRAVRALRGGECELALAGATSLLLDLKDLASTESLGVLSPDGRCHTFDARANGYVKGEGVGLLVLKPLERALADGDPIHAVIRGSAVNHGGRAQSLTAPNPEAQRELIHSALADAGVDPETLGYIETHGTGTELGDPIEIEALKEVFAGLPPASVALGAVKANIGHLEPASGIAGLFKSVLALRHRVLPPVADLQTINPYIDLADSALHLPRTGSAWPEPWQGSPRRAGVSAFGFGGANAHVIIEAAPVVEEQPADASPLWLLLSAPETALLAPYARDLATRLEAADGPSLRDTACTLMLGRTAHPARAAISAEDRDNAVRALRDFAQHLEFGTPPPAGLQLGQSGEAGPLACLGEAAEDQAFFAQLAQAGRLDRLARFWTAGCAIDWGRILESLSPAQRGRRVHLPGVPWRQQRCWVEAGRPLTAGLPAREPQAAEAKVAQATATTPPVRPVTPPEAPSKPLAASRAAIPAHVCTVPHPASRTAPSQPEVTTAMIAAKIRDIIAGALYVAADDLDDQARFMDLGLDSILAVEVTRAINLAFDLQIQATRLYDYPSVADLAAYVSDALNRAPAMATATAAAMPADSGRPEASSAAGLPPSPASVSLAETAEPIVAIVRRILATALYISPDDLDDQTGFSDLGLDSILAVEVADKLNAELGTDLQATRLYDYPTVAALAAHLADRQTRVTGTAIESAADPVLEFLRSAVAGELGVDMNAIDPALPLDRLAIGPEQAARILAETERRFGCRLDAPAVGACRDLTAVARLIGNHATSAAGRTDTATHRDNHTPPTTVPNAQTRPATPPTDSPASGTTLDRLRAELAALLCLPPESLETNLPLADLGLDLVAVEELADRCRPILGAATPGARALLAAASLEALAELAIPTAVAELQPDPGIAEPTVVPSAPIAPAGQSQQSAIKVAVVGIACRYPGASDKDAFWNLLREGRSGITRVPAERWNPQEHLAGLARPEQRDAVQWGGFVSNVDRFDPLFFNLSPREAELMDPQQRLVLEEAWHAFEDAGLTERQLQGARCGIFIGAGQGDYSRHLPMDDPAQVTGQLLLGNTASILVARIAYLLDLRGSAVALDTACSSALVAAEMGFRAIREGSCDLALVGGVNLMTTPQMHVMTAASGMLAPDGRCRTFDDAASGFVPGEGVGLLVLRRLDHALAEHDRIYGVIEAAGTNQDGKTSGITAPSSTSQEQLERDVWQRFGIDPAGFGYIEAHGTGTRLGDPIEIDALTRAFAAHTTRRQDCPIGSVKTNIGHTLASAGAAGLIKTLLALHHEEIPPSLNFGTPNRHIDFAHTPFFVPTQAMPWRERRLAAVSSFGFSGTNAHLVLAAAPTSAPRARQAASPDSWLFVLTARDPAGLVRQAERLATFLSGKGRHLQPLDVAHTLAVRRSHLEQRLAVQAPDLPSAADALRAFAAGQADNRVIGPNKRRRDPLPVDAGLLHRATGRSEALAELARLWTEGSPVTWTDVFGGGRFVDLPLTAFAELRCWIDTADATPSARIAPVATSPAEISYRAPDPMAVPNAEANADQVLELSASTPIMANHRVHGQPMLPGMASLAWFHAEARRRGYLGPLTGVKWRLPVIAPARLTLTVEATPEALKLMLHDVEQREVACAHARRTAPPRPLPVDLAAIRADCRVEIEPAAIYLQLERGGVEHGSAFRLLDSVMTGAGQILATLRPAAAETAMPIADGGLPPALLDSALQALGGLEIPGQPAMALLPAGVRRVVAHAPLAGNVLAWLTVDAGASGEGRLVADLRLLDEAGEVLAELLGFEARAPQLPSPPPPGGQKGVGDAPYAAASAELPPLARIPEQPQPGGVLLVMRPHWTPTAAPDGSPAGAPLVLHGAPEADWAARLVDEQGGEAIHIDTLTPEAMADCVANWPETRPLVFAAWREPAAKPLDAAALSDAEQRGVHRLRGVFQGLARRGGTGSLVLATRGVQGVLADERIDPAFAALPGFARAAARELPDLVLACVDLPLTAPPADGKRERAWLARESAGAMVAYREGLRLRQRLSRVVPDTTRIPSDKLPPGLVCLLVGGAGGLGQAASLRLAARCGARLAWVGRRPRDTAIETALTAIERAGGAAIYLQADVTDPAQFARAVAQARERWGHIGLAWHGAIQLRDKTAREMSAADLDAALTPKSHGLLNLISALADDPPNWLCLCSSANAFTVNPGQANYAAACTFVDALALAQTRELGWNVRVLNWGIWGETGIVAEERYLQRARHAGVEPLGTAEALDVFEWSLQAPLPQAIPMKVSASALADIETDLAETVRLGNTPAALDLTGARRTLHETFERIETESLRQQADTLAELIRHGRERLFRIYAELGLNRHAPAPLPRLAAALGIVPERLGLFRAHLEILARCGWVRLTEDPASGALVVAATGLLPIDPPRHDLPTGGAARLLEAALAGTADVLTGQRPATKILFPDGRDDLVAAVYRDDPAAALFNTALAAAVGALGHDRALRVIEIGAGTGGATGAVLEALDRHAPGSTYVYTDVSPHFVAAGEARHGRRPNTAFRTLDIGRHPAAQGLEPGSFDLLIAANVLHALPDIQTTLAHAKALLKPGGAGLLLEATSRSDFATFIFGLTDGWWAFGDADLRIAHSPLLSTDGWRIALDSQGLRLAGVGQIPGSDAQSILLLESDGWLPQPLAGRAMASAVSPAAVTVANPQGQDSMLNTVRRLVCQLLRMTPADLDPDEPLERYGVDSLVVNDIHARLESELGKFSRNLVYDAVTLRALADRLEATPGLSPTPVTVPETPATATAAPARETPPPAPPLDADAAIAVIGIAGRFPGAETIEAFWDNLERGAVAIGPLPEARRALWPADTTYPGGYLPDVAGFDSLFFSIAPNEAAAMDPQERLFLETAWSSLENTGRLPTAWDGKVGVFVGVMGRDYLRLSAESHSLGDAPAWSVANRVSHALNLNGPSLAVDTACSSALTALHLAAESLRRGDCDAALAGSVHLILHPASREGLQALGMLSPSGKARPFSAEADGLVGGEGVCCLVLRRLTDALAANDRILGVVRATGLAANGRTRNYMAPNAESQAEGLRRFMSQWRLTVPDYVECQAVGSPLNDAIEVAGLARALPPTATPINLGSVEGAIGHLEAASGSAQIAKVLGMFDHGRLLPSVGIGPLSEGVTEVLTGRFAMVREDWPWGDSAAPRQALVQSFGAGGGAAFALVEPPPTQSEPPADPAELHVVPLSARTPSALRSLAGNLLAHLRDRGATLGLAAVARTLQTGRVTFNHRLAVLARDLESLAAGLRDFLAGQPGAWRQGERRGAGANGKGPGSHAPEDVAAYWAKGHAVDWDVLWPNARYPVPVALPGYAFEHRHCWIVPETAPVAQLRAMPERAAPVPPCQADTPANIGTTPTLPPNRKRVVIPGPGEPEDLRIEAETLTAPPAREVLIEVRAAGLNFADLLCLRGLHPNLQSFPHLPGFEVAGIVAAVGEQVAGLRPGQPVMALTGGRGGLASHVTVPAHWVAPIPMTIDLNLAAATPIGYLTMAHALERANLRAGETILIQSAAGGTGPFAVQLALARGAIVIATAGSAAKLEALRELGARHVINYREQDFAEATRAITGGRGVDVVLNTLDGDAIQKGIDLLAPGGRYCEIALAGLRSAGALDLSRLMDNQSLITINLGRVLAEPDAARSAFTDMADALTAGRVRPLISAVFGMDRMAEAFHHMDRRENIGKIIIQPDAAIAVSPTESARRPRALPEDLVGELGTLAAGILGLATEELDPGRPLEDYGFNSVSAVALLREIHRRFGYALPVNQLRESGSLAALAEQLAAEAADVPQEDSIGSILTRATDGGYDPLVPIRKGHGPGSFWVHGAPGDASWVSRLAQVLGGDGPVYGIEARGVNGKDAPRRNVTAMAQDYVSALQRMQPQGPYRLGGYSGGGVIAYEMARQLLAGGETIDKLILLDAYAPGNPALQSMGAVYGDGFIYQLAVNWFGRGWGLSRLLTPATLAALKPEDQLTAALDHLYQYAHPEVERQRLAAYLQGMDRVGRALGKALETYTAKPLQGKFDTLLIRCAKGMSDADNPYGLPIFLVEADYTAGWQHWLGKPLQTETIACDHFSLLDDPWIEQAGAAINRFLEAEQMAKAPMTESAPADPRDHVRKVVEEEIRRVLMIDLADGIPARASLADLGAHSVDRAEVAANAMERLDVSVPLAALAGLTDIDSLIEVLTNRVGSP